MAATTEAERADHLDHAWLRERIEELAAIERPSASEGEHRAAQLLAERLREAGARDVRIEAEPEANGTYWISLGALAGAGAAAGLAALRGGRGARAAATLIGAAAAALVADELPPGRRRFRRLLPKRSAHHVLAELGPPDADRTVVVMAHHDAAHSAFFFNPAITEAIGERYPQLFENNDTSPPLMWPVMAGPALVAAGAATGLRPLTRAGVGVSGGTVGFMADIGSRDVVPGANDNATACVAQVALARALSADPTRSTRVLFLSTSEEALCEGMGLFMDRHAHELPRESTFFLCLDTIGSPRLCVLRGEGMKRMRDYPAESLELMDSTADQLGIELIPNLRFRNATDGVFPLHAGYQCASVCSCNHLKNPSNYHWPTDVPENIDYSTLADAIRLAERVIRRLDAEWIQRT
jgi:hypothetical protein